MNRAEQALAFCSALFADGGDTDGIDAQRVTVFTLPQGESRWLPVTDPAAIATAAIEADATAAAVYVSMAASSATPRSSERGKTLRFKAEEVTAVFGLWADLDIADGEAHAAQNLPPDEAAIRRILDAAGLKPTVFWSSGHGYQAFWRFDVPYLIESDAEREEIHKTLVAWQKTLAAHAHRLGAWRVDMVHDLARVLRVPGTTNRKTAEHVPARLVEVDETALYTVDEINERCLDAEWLATMSVMTTPTGGDNGAASVDLHAVWKIAQSYRQQRYEPEWVTEVLRMFDATASHRAKRFRRIWRQSVSGVPFDDHSASDASMARFVADYAGPGTEAEAMELVMCLRLRSQWKVDKVAPDGRGSSYLVNTVARVYHQAKLDEEKRLADTAAAEQVAAVQDAEMYDEPERGPEPVDDSTARARSLGGASVATLAERTGGTLPDPAGEEWHAAALGADPTPAPATPPEPEPDPPLDEADEPDEPDPRDELPDPDDDPDDDEPEEFEPPSYDPDHDPEPHTDPLPQDEPLDEPAPRDGAAGSDDGGDGGSPPPPPPTDPEPPADDDGEGEGNPGDGETSDPADDAPEPEYTDERERPFGAARSAFAPRRDGTAQALRAISADLLSRYQGNVEIWGGEQRGTGQDMKRCLIIRVHRALTVGDGTIRYVPGEPVRTGWYPALGFKKIGTWIAALETLQLRATPIRQQDFDQRHSSALVAIWRNDSTGGSLDEIAREALANFLLDHSPVRQWEEAMAMGEPWIMMRGTPWSVAGQFVVCIQWNQFARYLRGNRLGMQVGPERMADVAVALRVEEARTPEQPGRWRRVRREIFSDQLWAQILAKAEEKATTREARAGLKLISGGQAAGGGR